MTEESKTVLLAEKISKIISYISELFNLSINEATDIFYNSSTSEMIEEGIADLHCRSEKYLATLVWEEYQESGKNS
ncbi:MAG: DUF3791 domain-containing protein [Paramuribaculum sp.]|nr:DUF3791 domain-containing protein [Paramuribaculum sp.]